MKIRIERHPPDRGRKIVIVDGKPWAVIEMSRHGHGASYNFYQLVANMPVRWIIKQSRVWGDAAERREMHGPGEPRPLAERLFDKARSLIDSGELRDPEIVGAEHRKRMERASLAEQQARNDRQREWDKKIESAIGHLVENPAELQEACEAIRDLMSWAQTQ